MKLLKSRIQDRLEKVMSQRLFDKKKQLAIVVRQEFELAMAKRLKQSELPNARIVLEA
tara:strand:- start:589 stop:762 length:174 start_codon:yes stop_codon:yes gene_type:complete